MTSLAAEAVVISESPPRICQSCGREVTKRNVHGFSEFMSKPICKLWKPCYRRRTGKTAPRAKLPRVQRMTIRESQECVVKVLAADEIKKRNCIEHEMGAHSRDHMFARCPLCSIWKDESLRVVRERLYPTESTVNYWTTESGRARIAAYIRDANPEQREFIERRKSEYLRDDS